MYNPPCHSPGGVAVAHFVASLFVYKVPLGPLLQPTKWYGYRPWASPWRFDGYLGVPDFIAIIWWTTAPKKSCHLYKIKVSNRDVQSYKIKEV